MKVLLAFSMEREPSRDFVRLVLGEYYSGSHRVEGVAGIFLGWIACSIPFSKVPSRYANDENGEELQVWAEANCVRECMGHDVNKLGELAIVDLMTAWPSRDEIISYLSKALVRDGDGEDFKERMQVMPDPGKLVFALKKTMVWADEVRVSSSNIL